MDRGAKAIYSGHVRERFLQHFRGNKHKNLSSKSFQSPFAIELMRTFRIVGSKNSEEELNNVAEMFP